jgi:hypothetical protein
MVCLGAGEVVFDGREVEGRVVKPVPNVCIGAMS